jgi:hypothetical protein
MSVLRSCSARRLTVLAIVALAAASTTACLVIFRGVRSEAVDTSAPPDTIVSSVKVHLSDGSTVLYPAGIVVTGDTIRGTGTRYGITGGSGSPQPGVIPLDSVAAMENFTTTVDGAATTVVSLVGTAAVVAATAGLAVLAFGSCPTVYSDSAGHPLLEAETFSYSIAPLFEQRDVDLLHAQPDSDGMLSLEVRNEALETHYINHLQLLEAAHDSNEEVLPGPGDQLLALSHFVPPSQMRDRAGRDLRWLTEIGEEHTPFGTDSLTLAAANVGDFDDYIDIDVPAPPGVDSVAIVLDMRNSLLNTVLLYDMMLGRQGARAVDWIGKDLADIGAVVTLGRWYTRTMGMHVAVLRDGHYEQTGYIPDAGPIAWHRVAVMVPVQGDTLHARLSFVADQWRIRRVGVAAAVRYIRPRLISAIAVTDARGVPDSAALHGLHDSDQDYLVTTPGQHFQIRFDAGAAHGASRTFLLASQGYYIEWVRGAWIREAATPVPFVPGDSVLARTLERWRTERPGLESRFASSRIPVR